MSSNHGRANRLQVVVTELVLLTSLFALHAQVLPGLCCDQSLPWQAASGSAQQPEAVRLQAGLDIRVIDRCMVEELRTAHSHSFMGAWLYCGELFLSGLPSNRQPEAEQLVGPAPAGSCCSQCVRSLSGLEAFTRSLKGFMDAYKCDSSCDELRLMCQCQIQDATELTSLQGLSSRVQGIQQLAVLS